jgi:hypothetical protein
MRPESEPRPGLLTEIAAEEQFDEQAQTCNAMWYVC